MKDCADIQEEILQLQHERRHLYEEQEKILSKNLVSYPIMHFFFLIQHLRMDWRQRRLYKYLYKNCA